MSYDHERDHVIFKSYVLLFATHIASSHNHLVTNVVFILVFKMFVCNFNCVRLVYLY